MKEIIKKWHNLRDNEALTDGELMDEFDAFINGLLVAESNNDELLNKSVFSLDLSIRLINQLKAGGMETCRDLLTRTKRDYWLIPGFGKKSLTELEDFFSENRLKFKE